MNQIMGTDGEIEIDQDFDDENIDIINPQVFVMRATNGAGDYGKKVMMSDLPSSRSVASSEN